VLNIEDIRSLQMMRKTNLIGRGVQKNRITEKTEKTEENLTEKTEPR
jgi:hypothetical protein